MVVFQEKAIRRTWHSDEWWFAIVDVVAVLTDSVEIENPELARACDLHQAKGYPQACIEMRLRSTAVRGELTDERTRMRRAGGKEYSWG